MKSILEYKGYHAKVEIDIENKILDGKIEGIRDLVNFESDSVDTLEQEFHDAVDDYLEFCQEMGKEPDKEYSGTFNVRISSELHKKLALKALENGESLNKTVEKAIGAYVNGSSQTEVTLNQTPDQLSRVLRNRGSVSTTERFSFKSYGVYTFGDFIEMSYQS